MTPESIRILSGLRNEFYALFSSAMNVPVKISGSSYNSIAFVASWLDERERLNYLNIYACSAPDDLTTQRPLILRLAINKGAGNMGFSRQGRASQGLNHQWHFELTVMPDELLDFLPWVVSLAKAKGKNNPSLVQVPPYPVSFKEPTLFQASTVWTQKAEQTVGLQHEDPDPANPHPAEQPNPMFKTSCRLG
jgi:hypothetical protein